MTQRFNKSKQPVTLRTAGFYTRQEVETLTTLSRTTIYERGRAGTFPAPVSLGSKCTGWRCSEVNAWLDDPADWQANLNNENQPEQHHA